MATTQYYAAASLDGYIAETDGSVDWLNHYEGSYSGGPGAAAVPVDEGYARFWEDVGALVSGSVTYEFVRDNVGPADDWPYPDKPYWVLSSRELPVREGLGIDVRITDAPIAEVHRELVDAAGEGNVWIVGGGDVASQFAEAGLLDELIVTVVPVVIGSGRPLFRGRLSASPLQLIGTRAFDNGMVELRYELTRAGGREAPA